MTRTALYRHYDEAGVLLYVGVSLRPMMRLDEHMRSANWRGEIARVELEWFPTTDDALAAEREAIGSEAPLRNINRPAAFAARHDRDHKILHEIDDYARRRGVSPQSVCRAALSDTRGLQRLTARLDAIAKDEKRLRSYMADNPPAASPSERAS